MQPLPHQPPELLCNIPLDSTVSQVACAFHGNGVSGSRSDPAPLLDEQFAKTIAFLLAIATDCDTTAMILREQNQLLSHG